MKTPKTTLLLLIIFFAVLQCTLLNTIKILGIKPDILLILIVFIGLHLGPLHSFCAGTLAGTLIATTSALPYGIATAAYSSGALILGYLGKWFYPALFYSSGANFSSPIFHPSLKQRLAGEISITLVVSLIIHSLLYFLLQLCNTQPAAFLNAFFFVILPLSLYTAFVCPVVFCFIITVLQLSKNA